MNSSNTKEQSSIQLQKEWLTVKDLAMYLNLSVSTIYKKVNRDEIPHLKPFNGKLFFKLRDISMWLEWKAMKQEKQNIR